MPRYIILNGQLQFQRGGPFRDAETAHKYLGPVKSTEEMYVAVGRKEPPPAHPTYTCTYTTPSGLDLHVTFSADPRDNSITLHSVEHAGIQMVNDITDRVRTDLHIACLRHLKNAL